MTKGITFALLACMIWGLIFIVPGYMQGFTSLEVAIGRYAFYSLLSICLFAKSSINGSFKYPRLIWIKSIYFSLIATFGYYIFVILAVRYSNPAICALILGTSPIAIAFYGNLRQKEMPFRKLVIPSILILIGLTIINIPHFQIAESPKEFIFGIACSLAALAAWTWYVEANSSFLKKNPSLNPTDWSTILGVTNSFWVLAIAGFASLFLPQHLSLNKFAFSNPHLVSFILGSAILGFCCSWIGAYLWNRASLYLPVSLAGQLTIFETIFGVLYFYLLEGHIPPFKESGGILLLLVAIYYSMKEYAKAQTTKEVA